jgi:CHAT domain-containing protein
MGACKSGLARTELGAEFIGLPSVFLSAGAQYVIGSLWSVDDLATVILLDQFFELLGTEARLVPNALNEAERRLARMTSGQVLAWLDEHMSPRLASAYKPVIEKMGSSPFDSPFFWAGFYVSGDI